LTYLTAFRPGAKVALTAVTGGRHPVSAAVELPPADGTTPVAPTHLIPSAGYSAGGTLVIGLVVGGLILLASCFWFASRRDSKVRARIEPHLAWARPGQVKARRREERAATRARFVDTIESAFGNLRHFRRLERSLQRSDLPLRPGELLAISAGAAFFLGMLGAVAGIAGILTLALMAVGFALPIGYVAHKARGRTKRFENQLPDLLITLAASLKAGHSFRQGVQSVVEEGAEPAADEFKRVLTETQLGKPMDDALAHMAERVGSENFTFVVNAVTIQRQIGGSLAGLFDMVADVVRQRQQFARRLRSLTAMGRMSAYVLVGLPFFLAAVVTLLNPAFMAPLWHTGTGHTMVAVSLTMIVIGSLMLKKIASFRG
jgi:tight adherence protein B